MTVLGVILLVLGVVLMLIAALGVVRLNDPLQRMHSATKAGTLGTTLVVVAAFLLVDDVSLSTTVLTVMFLLFTLPFGGQLLGRASYLSGVKLEGIEGDPISELKRDEPVLIASGKAEPSSDGEARNETPSQNFER